MPRVARPLGTLAVGLLIVFPFLGPPIYFIHLLAGLYMNVALASSWALLGGYTGYLSLGQVTFFGIGAYTAAIGLSTYGISPFLTAPLGGIFAVLLALTIGYPSLRLRGPYFSVTTLSIAFLAQVAASNTTQMGGGYGIQLPSMPLPIWQTEGVFYLVFMILAGVVVWSARRMERSRFGLALLALRNDEDVAEVFGVDVVRVKLKAFVLSAFFPGVVGAIWAYQISYIDPHSAFDIGLSIDMLLMAMFGGAGRWAGPIVGASLVYLLSQTLVFVIPSELNRVVFGIILVLVVFAMPQGIIGFVEGLWIKRAARRTSGASPSGPVDVPAASAPRPPVQEQAETDRRSP
jgi:branched-chain amino acid transport system permease protein